MQIRTPAENESFTIPSTNAGHPEGKDSGSFTSYSISYYIDKQKLKEQCVNNILLVRAGNKTARVDQ